MLCTCQKYSMLKVCGGKDDHYIPRSEKYCTGYYSSACRKLVAHAQRMKTRIIWQRIILYFDHLMSCHKIST